METVQLILDHIQTDIELPHAKNRRSLVQRKMLDVDKTLVSRVDTKRRFSRCDGGGKIIPWTLLMIKTIINR